MNDELRPRRASRNDLFSMDWKWNGSATGTEIRPDVETKVAVDIKDGSLLGLGIGVNGQTQVDEVRTPTTPTFKSNIFAMNSEGSIIPSPRPLSSPVINSKPAHIELSSSNPPVTPRFRQTERKKVNVGPVDPNLRVKLDFDDRRAKLGSGRYSSVHLARYKTCSSTFQGGRGAGAEDGGLARTGWNICAVKVFNGDEQGWDMARQENQVLVRLKDLSRNAGNLQYEGQVVSGLGLIPDSQIEEDEQLEGTLESAGIPLGYSIGPGSPVVSRKSSIHRSSGVGFGKGLPGRIISLDDDRRSVSDSHLAGAFGSPRPSFEKESARLLKSRRFSGDALPRPLLLVGYVSRGNIETFIKRSPERVGSDLWMKWFKQGLQALARIHQGGVIHCDIKPSNLLLDDDLNLVLADFSSSVIVDNPENLPTDGIGRGTPPFSSPEMVDPSPTRPFGYASDMFSFGATMYSLITGTEPFRGVRSIELMWNVRKGRFWEWEERARLMNVGKTTLPVTPTTPSSTSSTPAGRQPNTLLSPRTTAQTVSSTDRVRRSGSLRETVLSDRNSFVRPKLPRMSSSELLITPEVSPSDTSRLQVVVGGNSSNKSMEDILRPSTSMPPELKEGRERAKSLIIDTKLSNAISRQLDLGSPVFGHETIESYTDGTPAMMHVNGRDRVDEVIWSVLRRMVDPVPDNRGSAEHHLRVVFGVGK
jgi:serine/threonine protein kinase